MEDSKLEKILDEIKEEHHISPFRSDDEFINYIRDGIFDINMYCGKKINYEVDLKARRLLKNYVLYADYKKLAEFKQIYIGEYDELQRQYYVNSCL